MLLIAPQLPFLPRPLHSLVSTLVLLVRPPGPARRNGMEKQGGRWGWHRRSRNLLKEELPDSRMSKVAVDTRLIVKVASFA